MKNATLLLLFLLYIQSSLSSSSICEPITTPHCLAIGYNQTFYSSNGNLLGHRSQAEAASALYDFYGLMEVNCSPDLTLLLCSLFTPICIHTKVEEIEGSAVVQPLEVSTLSVCRPVCERAQLGCQGLMAAAGFPWPHFLNCSHFPVEFCMENSHHHQQNVLDEAEVEVGVLDVSDFTPDPLHKTTKPTNETSLQSKQAALVPYLNLSDKAGTAMLTIIIVTSVIAVALSIFALLTVFALASSDNHRLEYPNSVLPYTTACWLVTSTLHLLSALLEGISGSSSLSSICIIHVLFLNYLSAAGDYWAAVWALTWYLKARKAWAEEAIHRQSTAYHLFCWLLPAGQLAASLLLQANTFHACYDSSLPLEGHLNSKPSSTFYLFHLPTTIVYLLSVYFLASSIVSLQAIHRTVRLNSLKDEERGNEEVDNYFLKEAAPVKAVLCRLVPTSIGYCLLQLTVLLTHFYCQFGWKTLRNGVYLFQLVGSNGSALLGIGSSLVILTSEDTLEAWVQLFRRLFGIKEKKVTEGQPTIITTTATTDTMYASILGSDEEEEEENYNGKT